MIGAGVKGAVALFGPDFAPTGSVLQILAVSVLLMYAYVPYQQALILFDRQMALFTASAVAAGVAIATNFVLVRAYGLYGAAWSNVITNAVIWIELVILCGRLTPLGTWNRDVVWASSASLVAAIAACAAMWLLGGEPLSMPVGCTVFLACWLLTGPRQLITPARWRVATVRS
jgi:O-antigen/teichoic acid export membrane protein